MKLLLLGIMLALSTALHADKVTQKAGAEEIMPLFKKAWNKNDIEALMSMYDPESKMGLMWQDDAKKEKLKGQFLKMIKMFGNIEASAIGVYIADKDRYVIKYTYKEKGLIPGTIQTVKKDGKWIILDWNIDGQGEEELKM